MSLNLYYDRQARLDREVSDLQKKIADESKKELDKQKQIDDTRRSINSHTSAFTIQSKERQIQGYQRDIIRIQSAKVDLHKRIADKARELAKVKQDLQREEIKENQKLKKEQEEFRRRQEAFQQEQVYFQKEQERLQKKLQIDIANQKEILNTIVQQVHGATRNLMDDKEFDFFISHATEDKDMFVRPLAELLMKNGQRVWYDEFELRIGDSLRKKIDEGLKCSKYGIAVLSRDFFRKNWTEYELNGLVAREMNGYKVILPIWHNVTRDEVLSFSPTMADRVALNTAIHSLKEIATELTKLVDSNFVDKS